MLRDINMLLRKDALMKVDKRWKNMSARPDVVPALGGGDCHGARERVFGSGDDTAVASATLLLPARYPYTPTRPCYYRARGAGCGRGRIHQTPFVLMKLPTMVHAR